MLNLVRKIGGNKSGKQQKIVPLRTILTRNQEKRIQKPYPGRTFPRLKANAAEFTLGRNLVVIQ